MTKKQLDEHKKKLTNVRDDNTKLRRQLREMSTRDGLPVQVDSVLIEKKLRQAETVLTNTKAVLVNKEEKLEDARGRVEYLESVLKSNIILIENLRTSIYKYKKLGFWGRVDMAFTSKENVAKFFE